MDHKEVFNKLWVDYSKTNPSVNKIHAILKDEGEDVINDHIAFRTFDLPGINIEKLAQIFIALGYEERGTYYFETKKLNARHYEHKTDALAPKVFISELITGEFSSYVQKIAKETENSVMKSALYPDNLIYMKNPWSPFSYNIYKSLLNESEYAAWMYVYGFRANHFTVFTNYLKKYNSLEKLNQLLIKNGFVLNSSGGVIKGTETELLRQSSILADEIDVEFIEGIYKIPCCYYEFAQRYEDNRGRLFQGFIANSADKIFESTNAR